MPEYRYEGFLRGSRLSPLRIAQLCYAEGWRDRELVIAVAVCLAESAGYDRAFNNKWEVHPDGSETLVSRDVGLFQISILANRVGTKIERDLLIPEENVAKARGMFIGRRWQPWRAFTNSIATNPEMRGKYIQRACWAVMNLRRQQFGMRGVPSPYVRLGPWRLTRWLEKLETSTNS